MEAFFPRLKAREWAVVIGLLALYSGLVVWNLTKLPIFVDEALYLRWAQIAWKDASWRFISLTDGKQPFYIWFVIPFMKVIADPLYAGRLASAVAGLVTVIGMGYLGWLLNGKKTGFFAMLLAVFSPYLFFYYRFGIMESLLVASVIWVCSFSVLLARTRRLDIALLLGMIAGGTLLVKSSALFFILLIPAAYVLQLSFRKPFTKQNFRYLGLVSITWILAYVIYNVQRLSPWMHMIAEKNSFFIVGYDEIFREPKRLINNFFDVWRWQWAYTTGVVLAFSVTGAYALFKNKTREAWLAVFWLAGPMLGTVALARLFAPRYIIFVTPFVLLFAAAGLAEIKKFQVRLWVSIIVIGLLTLPLSRLILDPLHFSYVNVDEGYVNGWSAGNGTKQIAEWAKNRVREVGGEVKIYTEGTFGILPHGLELYTQGTKNLTITGLYPINDIPPAQLVSEAHEHPEVYLILNNTETPDVPAGLELIASYPKLRDNPMRLYKVIPR